MQEPMFLELQACWQHLRWHRFVPEQHRHCRSKPLRLQSPPPLLRVLLLLRYC